MKPLVVISTILFASTFVFAQVAESDPTGDAVRKEITRLEAQWNIANEVSDPETKKRLLASHSYHVGPSGRLYNKSQDIRAAEDALAGRKPGQTIRFEISDKRIRLYDGVAVVTGTGRKFQTKNGVTTPGASFRFVHVWEKQKDGWLLAVDQVTAVQ